MLGAARRGGGGRIPPGGVVMRARALVALAFGLAAAWGCGGTAARAPLPATRADAAAASDTWVDTNWSPDTTILVALAIAPVPFAGDQAHQVDQGLERVFRDTPRSQLRGQPAIIRQRMNGNRNFVLAIDRIRSAQYTPAQLATADLTQMFTPKEMVDLRTWLNSSALFLVPVEFTVTPARGGTDARVLYRVYDLATGKLLLQSRVQRRVAEAGEPGHREATIQIILALQEDFATRLMP
jgi:hypothetical protein